MDHRQVPNRCISCTHYHLASVLGLEVSNPKDLRLWLEAVQDSMDICPSWGGLDSAGSWPTLLKNWPKWCVVLRCTRLPQMPYIFLTPKFLMIHFWDVRFLALAHSLHHFYTSKCPMISKAVLGFQSLCISILHFISWNVLKLYLKGSLFRLMCPSLAGKQRVS